MAKEQTFEHPPGGHVAILIYDPTNDRFQVVHGDDVDTAIPAAGKSLLASALAHGYDGSAWRKLPLVWGYTDRYAEPVYDLTMPAGWSDLSGTAVPAGEVWRVTGASFIVTSASCTQARVVMSAAGIDIVLANQLSPVSDQLYPFAFDVTLKAVDYMYARYYGMTLNDDAYLWLWGSKMNVAM